MTTSTDATTDATPASAPAPASPPPPASPAAAYPGADPGSSYVPAVLAPPADRRTDEDYGRDEGIGRNVYLAAFLAVAAGMLFAAAWWWNIAWPVFVAGVILWDCAKAGIRVALLVFHPDYRTPDEARRDRIDDALIVAKHLAESMRGVRSLIAVRVADDGRSLILLFDEAAEDKDLAACARNIPAVGRPTPVSWVSGEPASCRGGSARHGRQRTRHADALAYSEPGVPTYSMPPSPAATGLPQPTQFPGLRLVPETRVVARSPDVAAPGGVFRVVVMCRSLDRPASRRATAGRRNRIAAGKSFREDFP